MRNTDLNVRLGKRTRLRHEGSASEATFRTIFEQAAAGIAQIETATGRFVRANRRYCEIVGLSKAKLLATTFMGVMNEDDLQGDLRNMNRLRLGDTRSFSMEKRLVRNDGSSAWVKMRVSPMWAAGEKPSCHLVVAEDISEHKRMEEALRASYCRLKIVSQEVRVAAERERNRLSRELHDEFGQVLSGLKFDLVDMVRPVAKMRVISAAIFRTKVMRALGLVDRLFTSLKGMVSALRPSVLEQLGLVPALESLAADTQERSGLCCRVVADRENVGTRCGEEVESAIYRMAQELLTNVVRHAKATVATVRLCRRDGWVTVSVEDNGRGFNPRQVNTTNQFGLKGVAERAELLGGQIEIVSKLRVGTVVTIRLPLTLPTIRRRSVAPARRRKSPRPRKRRRNGN